jgi:hypothetical protein
VLNNARLYEDRIAFSSPADSGPDVVFSLSGTLSAGGTDLLYVNGAELAFTDVVLSFGGFNPFTGETVTIDGGGLNAAVSGITFSLADGVLLPDPAPAGAVPEGLAEVHGLFGSFDNDPANNVPDGTLEITVGSAFADLGLFQMAFTDSVLTFGPDVADRPLFSAGLIEVTVPLVDDQTVALTAVGLEVSRTGQVTLLSAAATAETGFLSSIGLGGLLPFDLTQVEIAGIDSDNDGTPDVPLLLNDPLSNTAFDRSSRSSSSVTTRTRCTPRPTRSSSRCAIRTTRSSSGTSRESSSACRRTSPTSSAKASHCPARSTWATSMACFRTGSSRARSAARCSSAAARRTGMSRPRSP